MSHIPDDRLFAYAHRVRGKVLVITGAANGIGKETVLRFASFGAKIVIGDLDIDGAIKVAAEIEKAGGTAACIKCDVTNFDNQTDMFALAMKKYGSVDIVVPNAGVAEVGSLHALQFKDGKPVKPNLKTLEVNLIGVIYTVHLAIHYLQLNQTEGDLKSLILIGSMASWSGVPRGDIYAASKHSVLGIMRSLHPIMELRGIRVGCIHPFFVDTGIVPAVVKILLAGIPLTPISRVAGAIFYAATDEDKETNGSAWLLTDDGPVFKVPREEFKLGVYKMIDDRTNRATVVLNGVRFWVKYFRDIWHITGKLLIFVALTAALAKVTLDNRDLIMRSLKIKSKFMNLEKLSL